VSTGVKTEPPGARYRHPGSALIRARHKICGVYGHSSRGTQRQHAQRARIPRRRSARIPNVVNLRQRFPYHLAAIAVRPRQVQVQTPAVQVRQMVTGPNGHQIQRAIVPEDYHRKGIFASLGFSAPTDAQTCTAFTGGPAHEAVQERRNRAPNPVEMIQWGLPAARIVLHAKSPSTADVAPAIEQTK